MSARLGRVKPVSGTRPSASTMSTPMALWRTRPLPSGLGTEAAGVVEAVGPNVTDVKVGDRVAYSGGPQGAYSEERIMPADRLIALPDGISDQQAAAMMLKGMTAQYLIRQTYRVKEGTPSSSMRRPVGLASLRANGPSRWAQLSSAPSAVTRRRSSPGPMAATIPSSTRVRTSSSG